MTPQEARDVLRKVAEEARGSLRESHEFSRFSQEHTDKMLTWAIGLMGIGLASGYSMLAHAPWTWRSFVLSPWALGILTALTGRILGAECRNRNDEYYSALSAALGLLQIEEDPKVMRKMLSEALQSKDSNSAKLKRRADRSVYWANAFYYATHVLFGLGVAAAAALLVATGPAPGLHL